MKPGVLPDSDKLRVDEAKARDYLLNAAHPDGGSKAVFLQEFGFARLQWQKLAEALRLHGQTRPVVVEKESKHGRKFEVSCNLRSPDGRNPCIRSIWIKEAENPTRLVTILPRP